ncbi:ATP-binding protein [Nocardiopsis halotolerans]|uniref:ATP-binding protein n=1 Tax=Nocardiopsis halotolerans TaxID=124252 RepID=UPI000348604D|nr:ATP-binding protein [Nocardiopsis halotolerans]
MTSVKDARDWLSRRMKLSQIPDSSAQDALLILSELATNALPHSPTGARGGAFLVSVFVSAQCLRISVRGSGDTRSPALQAVSADPESEHGRGLFLIDALASTWGVENTQRGPAVFFTMEWDSQQPPKPSRQAQLPRQASRTHHGHQAQPFHQPSTVPAPRTALRHPGGW